LVSSSSEILEKYQNEKIVAIDEVQFFDNELVDVCNQLANKGVRVILAGLDMDFQGVPFGPMPLLLSISEYVTKVHAVCVSCGNLAQFSHRIVEEGNQVLVGAVDKYQPLCRSCYIEKN
jgi:thymidine kinase